VGPDNRGQVGDSFLAELCTRSTFRVFSIFLVGCRWSPPTISAGDNRESGLAFGRSAIPSSSLRSSRSAVATAQVGSIRTRRGSELLFGFLGATGLGL
jgi:hypothetical protein